MNEDKRWGDFECALSPAILDTGKLRKRIDALRKAGVRIPDSYPPQNLEPSSTYFRGFLGELEVAELLASQFDPSKIEMLEPEPKQTKVDPDYVDADIILHTTPRYYLQIKDWISLAQTKGQQSMIDDLVEEVRRMIQEDVKSRHWEALSTVSSVTIKLDANDAPVLNGSTSIVNHPSIFRVHACIIEVDPGVYRQALFKKLKGSIRDAYGQLRNCDDGVIVPVINMLFYPHDQAEIYLKTKELLRCSPSWKQIGGILLITNSYGDALKDSNVARKPRIIAVSNPNADDERRMNESEFNPNNMDETVFSESMVLISVDVDMSRWRMKDGKIYVDGFSFCHLPDGLSMPSMLRVVMKSIG